MNSSEMAKKRWSKVSKKKRRAHAKMMVAKREENRAKLAQVDNKVK